MEIVDAKEIEDIECLDVKEEEIENLSPIMEEMIKLCAVEGGIGLAAPQVGLKKKLFVWRVQESAFQPIINPQYYPNERKKTHTIEACLSYRGDYYYLPRYKYVRAVYWTIQPNKKLEKKIKNLRGDDAIIFQHETDHCYGKTIRTQGELLKDKEKIKNELTPI